MEKDVRVEKVVREARKGKTRSAQMHSSSQGLCLVPPGEQNRNYISTRRRKYTGWKIRFKITKHIHSGEKYVKAGRQNRSLSFTQQISLNTLVKNGERQLTRGRT